MFTLSEYISFGQEFSPRLIRIRLVPSRYLNFNFIGTNRYISISIYIDQYQGAYIEGGETAIGAPIDV